LDLMSVTLPPQTEKQIQDWIDTGHYPDAAAVIDKALQALEAQEQAKMQRLRELVRAGFESGPAVELTDELWDEMEREVDDAYQRGEDPPPHAGP
jgi:putative addiction module CopG family antidote